MPDVVNPSEVGCTERRTNKLPRKRACYSPAEVRDLIRIVCRTREWLKFNQQIHLQNEKSIWHQIADEMHMKGWPKRHWTSVRKKGQTLLTGLGDNESNETQADRRDASAAGNGSGNAPLPSNQPSSRMSVALVESQSNNAQTARNHYDRVDNEPAGIEYATPPPPLIPSTQATACNMMSLMRTSRSDQMVGETGRSEMISPQIVSVTSRSVTESVPGLSSAGRGVGMVGANGVQGGEARQGYWRSDSLPVVGMTGERVMEQQRGQRADTFVNGVGNASRSGPITGGWKDIDVLISSDEEMETAGQMGSVYNQTGVSSQSELRHGEKPANVEETTDAMNVWRREERAKRMEIYAMRLEVLKLKKVYWQQKLGGLERVNSRSNGDWPRSSI